MDGSWVCIVGGTGKSVVTGVRGLIMILLDCVCGWLYFGTLKLLNWLNDDYWFILVILSSSYSW